jgi:hypothetical protein
MGIWPKRNGPARAAENAFLIRTFTTLICPGISPTEQQIDPEVFAKRADSINMKFLKKGKAKANEANGEDHGDAKDPESHLEQAPQAKIKEPAMVHKFGIADRLNDGVIARSTSSEKRSPDLVPLSKEFDVIRKHLRQLNISAQQYHDSLCKMNKQRSQVRMSLLPVTCCATMIAYHVSLRIQVAHDICAFAHGSPIEKAVCNTSNQKSFLSVYMKASADVDSLKYDQDILAYLSEWDNVVTSRVDRESKEVEKIRKTFMHYQTKVDSLRKKVNAAEDSGKETNEATAEKLKRNKEKLDEASKEFEDAARPLCVLIEEVVRQGWKDVLPLIKSMMSWETARSKNEASVFSEWKPSHLENGLPVGPWLEAKRSDSTDEV